MHPIRALVLKEIREHCWALVSLTFALAAALAVLLWNASREERILSLLQPAHGFLVLFVPAAALVLGHRLVVQEYTGSTQKFLEGLPISRLQMVSTKFLFGLAYLIGVSLTGLGVCALLATATEPIEARFLAILILKTMSIVFFAWALFFAMGFTGRFRIPIYVGLFFLFAYLVNSTEFDPTRVGPIALVEADRFVSERDEIPWSALIQTDLAALALMGLGFLVALIREGALVEVLSSRMSRREKAMTTSFLFFALLSAAILESKRPKEPFRFQEEEVVRSESLPISILYQYPWMESEARALLDHLERTLGGMIDALEIAELPGTRIAYDPSLDLGIFQTAELTDQDGLLVRANYDGITKPQRGDLVAYVIRGVLDISTRERSLFEPKRWIHDGFSRWWAQRGLEGDISEDEDILIGRAIVAADHVERLSEGIARWTQLRERVGEPMAEGLAFTGLRALEERAGRSAVMELARSVLGRAPPRDIRETLHEWLHPMPVVFERSTGRGWNEFLEDWEIWLAVHGVEPAVANLLARVPAMNGSVDVEVKEGWIRRIVARLVADDGVDTSSMTLCTLLHVNLGPFDHELAREDLLREDVDCSGELPPIEIIGRYGPGERIFVAIEFDSPALGAPVRIAAQRMEIE